MTYSDILFNKNREKSVFPKGCPSIDLTPSTCHRETPKSSMQQAPKFASPKMVALSTWIRMMCSHLQRLDEKKLVAQNEGFPLFLLKEKCLMS